MLRFHPEGIAVDLDAVHAAADPIVGPAFAALAKALQVVKP